MRIIIVGGVAGGMSTATRLRRLDENATITVLERGGHVSFADCGLPYYIGDVITDRSALVLQTPESLAARFDLDVRVRTEVVAINRAGHTVRIRDAAAIESELGYDKLVLAPGAAPIRSAIAGIERAMSLRDMDDIDRIVAAATAAESAVIIGGGFIGIEMAENLVHRGLRVGLVEAQPQVMAPLDAEMVAPVHRALREAGVRLLLADQVVGIGPDSVTTASGSESPADLVTAAFGVRPETALATSAGLAIGTSGGIAVDEHQRTNDPDIYAVGDATHKLDAITAGAALVPLGNTANLAGRRTADHICGLATAARPVLGTAIVGVFGLQVAATGINEKQLNELGRPMSLKLLVDADTRRDPRRPRRRPRGCRQTHRCAGNGNHRWHQRFGAGRSGVGLCTAVRLGEGPGEHARVRSGQPAHRARIRSRFHSRDRSTSSWISCELGSVKFSPSTVALSPISTAATPPGPKPQAKDRNSFSSR